MDESVSRLQRDQNQGKTGVTRYGRDQSLITIETATQTGDSRGVRCCVGVVWKEEGGQVMGDLSQDDMNDQMDGWHTGNTGKEASQSIGKIGD